MQSPCTVEAAAARLAPHARAEYRLGVAVLDGKTYPLCWREMGNVAHLVYEDGDQGLVPLAEFKRIPSI